MNTGPSPAAAIEDAAIAWLAERDDGFTPARRCEFAQWLHADPRHAATVARLEQTLGLLGELPEFRAELNHEFGRAAPVVPFPPVARPAPGRRQVRALLWAGLAATLLVGAWTGWRVLGPAHEVRYATATAGYERARLDDGSTLELNAATVARVRFTGAERHVKLESGEAHFEVAHDAARPFVVSAGGVFVRAVGTAFNVRFAPGAVVVTVVDGKVRVAQGADAASAAPSAPIVNAGERALVPLQAPAPLITPVDSATLRQSLAWQGTLAEFSDAPLAEVVVRFNCRNHLQLILADADLGTRPIGGTFMLDEPEAFARLLARDGEIILERRGEAELVLRRAR